MDHFRPVASTPPRCAAHYITAPREKVRRQLLCLNSAFFLVHKSRNNSTLIISWPFYHIMCSFPLSEMLWKDGTMKQGEKGRGTSEGSKGVSVTREQHMKAVCDLFMKRDMRGVICFQVSKLQGKVFKQQWRWESSKHIPDPEVCDALREIPDRLGRQNSPSLTAYTLCLKVSYQNL